MRCPTCEKFVSMDMSDPTVESIEIDPESGTVSVSVRIERCCSDCGEALKEAVLDMEWEPEADLAEHIEAHAVYAEKHEGQLPGELKVEEDDITSIEEGGGRYKKSYYGAEVSFTINCTCDTEFASSGTIDDKVAASQMDELC